MSLVLAGTGINFDLTLSAIERLKKADEVYMEVYTNPTERRELKKLEELIGRGIIVIERSKVEANFLIGKALNSDVALLASGDPLTATTHITLLMDAKKQNIWTEVFHNSSIYTAAAGKAGLQIYRFGKTATLVAPKPNYRPTSSLDIIRANLKADMHSLVLLDTEPQPMEATTALEMLSEFDTAIVLSRIGFPNEKITHGKPGELKGKALGKPPFALIIPAKLHVVESEYLELLK